MTGSPVFEEPTSDTRQLALLWGAAALACLALSPLAAALAGMMPLCPFKQLIGIPCPTCGTGRAALSLARLDIAAALVRYPLPSLGWIAFLGMGLWSGIRGWAGKGLPDLPTRLAGWQVAAVVAVLLLGWSYSILTGV